MRHGPPPRTSALRWSTALLVGLLAVLGSGQVEAQGIRGLTMAVTQSPDGSTLQQRVRLDARSEPLSDVLAGLIESGVPLAYASATVEKAGIVSCECAGTVNDILSRLTEGTGIAFRELSSGEIVLYARSEPDARDARLAGVIQGRVTRQDDGRPLADVSIEVLNTDIATITRQNGAYLLTNVPDGAHWVRASMLGFRADSQRVVMAEGETVEVNFSLAVDVLALDPLNVSVTTGTLVATERKSLGHSISVVTEDEIERSTATGLFELLQGTAPGVASFQSSSVNGAGGQLQIRGVSSVLGDQAPLIYVDGVAIDNGSAASNRAGGDLIPHPSVTGPEAGSQVRIEDLSMDQIERIEIIKGSAATTMYGSEAVNGVIQIFTKRGAPGDLRMTAYTEQGVSRVNFGQSFVDNSPYGDQIRKLFNDPWTQRYGVNGSGGSSNVTYSFGVEHGRDAGIVEGNAARETSVRASITPVATEKLNLRITGNLIQRSYESLDYSTLFDFVDSDGGQIAEYLSIETLEEALQRGSRSETDVQRMMGTATLSWNPFEIWQNQLVVGVDLSDELEVRSGQPLRDPFSSDFETENIRRDFDRLTARYVGSVSYPRTGPVTSTFSAGAELFRSEVRNLWIRGTGLPSTGLSALDFAENLTSPGYGSIDRYSAVATAGIFAQEQVGFYDRFFLTAGIRADGSSAFGDNFGMQVYPKVSASYVVEPVPWWQGKIRAAWGRSGKLPTPFAKVRTYAVSRGTYYDRPIISLDDYGNPDLSPEVGTEIELGIENYFFGNRASLEVTYWQQETQDALLRGDIAQIYGYGAPLVNLATLNSSGVEMAGQVTPLRTNDMSLSVGVTLTHLMENGEVSDLGDEEELDRVGNLYLGLKEGKSINSITYLDQRNFERVYVGSRVPTTYGGVSADLQVKRLRVSSNLSYGFGGKAFDHIQAQRDYANGFITTPFRYFDPQVAEARYIVPTDFIRLDVVRLSYRVPDRYTSGLGGIENVELWLAGRNLIKWDRWDNGDATTAAPLGTAGGQGPLYLSGTLERRFTDPQHFLFGARVTF